MTQQAEERNAAVLAVLHTAMAPLGPTEIGRRVAQPWSTYSPHQGNSSAITPILVRIKATRHKGGKWTKPETAA